MLRKYVVSIIFLLALIILTIGTFLQANDLSAVIAALAEMQLSWLGFGVFTAILFVVLEGVMIWYLLRSFRTGTKLYQCVSWSFIGFFISGITPSATGGQPMQVYYMKRSGIPIAESTPILMIIAVLYKLVMAVVGLGISLFWSAGVAACFGKFLWLFYLGLGLNILVVALLTFFMLRPILAERFVLGIEKILTTVHLLKKSADRQNRWRSAVGEYQLVVDFFREHKGKLFVTAIVTFIQRCLPFLMIWIVYRGLGLSSVGMPQLMAMQAAVILAVDLLPLPGSMGITELVFTTAFAGIFSGELLPAALCVSRGISFYLAMLVSALIFAGVHFYRNKRIANFLID